jgi:hypothetical protein
MCLVSFDDGMATAVDDAEAKKYSCCTCQQNLDYIHQQLNGWMQNISPYDTKMGTYQNLAPCDN